MRAIALGSALPAVTSYRQAFCSEPNSPYNAPPAPRRGSSALPSPCHNSINHCGLDVLFLTKTLQDRMHAGKRVGFVLAKIKPIDDEHVSHLTSRHPSRRGVLKNLF